MGHTGHTPRTYLKRTLYLEPHVKSEKLFGETLIFGKMSTFLENSRPFLCDMISDWLKLKKKFFSLHPNFVIIVTA